MNTLAVAFERAGLPPASVAFAAACNDLARLALNREADPGRAASVWIGLAGHPQFKAALRDFLVSVSEEMPSRAIVNSGADVGPGTGGKIAQRRSVPFAPEPEPAEDEARRRSSQTAQKRCGPSSAEPDAAGSEAQRQLGKIAQDCDRPLPAAPSIDRLEAARHARLRTAAALSGFYITERQGSRTPIEEVSVASIDRLQRQIGRRTVSSATQFFLLETLKGQLPAFAPTGHTVADVFSRAEIAKAGTGAQERAALLFLRTEDRVALGAAQ